MKKLILCIGLTCAVLGTGCNCEATNSGAENIANINMRDNFDPLVRAAMTGNFDEFYSLISRGADLNSIDMIRRNIGYYILQGGSDEIILYTLQYQDKNNLHILDEKDTFLWAAANGDDEIVGMLLDKHKGANNTVVTGVDQYEDTALILAATAGSVDVVKLLLLDGRFDINAKNNIDETALIEAASEGNTDVVKLLLAEKTVDVNAKDEADQTALIHAARAGSANVVKLLLADKRVDVNAQDTKNQTALIHAARRVLVDVVRLLLQDKRVNAGIVDNKGQTIFGWAAFRAYSDRNNDSLMDMLIDKFGSNAPVSDNDQFNILKWGAVKNRLDSVDQLLKGKISYESIIDKMLHYYSSEKVTKIMLKWLLDNGADVNIIFANAICRGNLEIAGWALANGANIKRK